MILSVSKLTKSFGDRVLFREGSFSVEKGDIVGLVGANGVGKTTLFNIITGKDTPDSGAALLSSGTKVGYLEQHVCAESKKTCYEETLSVFSHLFEIEEEQKQISEKLIKGTDDKLILRQNELIEEYENLGGLTYVSLTHSVLLGLGFSEEEQNMPVSDLSGGQKSKIGLAKLLLQKPDIMLLDEPTNHLDIESVSWLEKFISNSNATIIVISHDRYFLDKICNGIVEIYAGKMFYTKGNYTRHMQLKEERDYALTRHYENTMSQVNRLEGIIEQQKRWNREKNIKTAESKQKQIDRLLEGLEAPEKEKNEFFFNFTPHTESGEDVLSVDNLRMEFPEKVLYENVSFELKRGETACILGENGIGKTTLIKQIMRKGRGVKFGVGVQIGYFDQHQLNLTLSNTVLDEIHNAFPRLTDTEVRSALAVFGFKGEKVFDTLNILSGGERAKVSLCKLMLKRCNLLILDEPTNHLDIYSLDALENALMNYTGTLLIISHDRYFINRVSSKIIELKPTGSRTFIGNYESYSLIVLEEQTETSPGLSEKSGDAKKIGEGGKTYLDKKQRRSEFTKLKTALRKNEELILKLEQQIESLKAEMADESISSDYERISELSESLAGADSELEDALSEWETLSEKISEYEKSEEDNLS